MFAWQVVAYLQANGGDLDIAALADRVALIIDPIAFADWHIPDGPDFDVLRTGQANRQAAALERANLIIAECMIVVG